MCAYRHLLLALSAAAALGCGSGPQAPSLLPVKGKVLLDNEPINGGMVFFHPEESREGERVVVATGMIQSNGSYELTTGPQPGAAAGSYKVVIVAMGPPGGGGAKARVPVKYTDPKTSDLTVEVVENPVTEQYDLRLKK
jgi:hypothetical protein